MDIPSGYCYDGRLICGTMVQRQPSVLSWPAGRNKPAAMCTMSSVESEVPLTSVGAPRDEGIVNIQQADFVVGIDLLLSSF